MKRVKLFLAAAAALALVAFLGIPAASASASLTSLCKTEESPCAGKNQYPDWTTLQTNSSEAYIQVSTGRMTCSESSLDVGTHKTADPINVFGSEWTLGGCTAVNGAWSCVATAQIDPGQGGFEGSISWTEGFDGTLSYPSAGISAICKNAQEETKVDCTYTFESGASFDLNGGNPAQLLASGEPMAESGSVCPGDGPKFTSTYTVDSPKPLYLAPPAHGLFEAEVYPVELRGANSAGHVFGFLSHSVYCETALLGISYLEEPSETITATPSYSGCSVPSFPGSPSVTLDTNGCDYSFDAGIGGVGSMDIVGCAGAGMTFTVSNCKITIPPQTGIAPVKFATLGSGSEHEIEIQLKGADYQYSWKRLSGFACPPGEGTETHSMGGTWNVSAFDEEENQVGVWVN